MYAKVYGETTCGINGEQIIVEVDLILWVCLIRQSKNLGNGYGLH